MYKIVIRKNETGEIRSHTEDLEWEDHSEFWWTEGNMACDCNLSRAFAFAGGDDFDHPTDIACSDYLYSVLHVELENGEVIKLSRDAS